MNMEIPLCVIDAKTLVDHIQDIKHWIYGGHLRLVVPSSGGSSFLGFCSALLNGSIAIENVEQHYQKAIEPKPTAQDGPRPRSSGKPARREYPAFDINPRVAREYLARLKAWKEGEATSEQRDFFHEKENHGAVEFQQLAEQYTPWKDLDVEEEKPESVEGPPTTWAEALRRKQNLANGISGQPQVPKGWLNIHWALENC